LQKIVESFNDFRMESKVKNTRLRSKVYAQCSLISEILIIIAFIVNFFNAVMKSFLESHIYRIFNLLATYLQYIGKRSSLRLHFSEFHFGEAVTFL